MQLIEKNLIHAFIPKYFFEHLQDSKHYSCRDIVKWCPCSLEDYILVV